MHEIPVFSFLSYTNITIKYMTEYVYIVHGQGLYKRNESRCTIVQVKNISDNIDENHTY